MNTTLFIENRTFETMEKQNKYELFLPYITVMEAIRAVNFEKYKEIAIITLKYANIVYKEVDILLYQKKSSMADVVTECPDKYYPVEKDQPAGDEALWYDIACPYYITKDELYYDTFFAYLLGQQDLFSIDDFLRYQLALHYNNNTETFFRFLELLLRKHDDKLSGQHISTAKEWIELSKNKSTPDKESEEIKLKTKGKVKRQPDDKKTVLSQEQTALLIHFLQKSKIILKDEYLNNKEAGIACSMLTGYSADTLRQTLGQAEIDKISTSKNINDVINSLQQAIYLMNNEVKAKKKN